jgi:hypothetical protein
MTKNHFRLFLRSGFALCLCFAGGVLPAQQESLALLPNAPGLPLFVPADSASISSSATGVTLNVGGQTAAQNGQTPGQSGDQPEGQTKRILGIIPNFRSVNADVQLPPQSAKEKFITATQDSFDYSSILLPAVLAGYSQLTNATPEFHQGAVGYGRYFWHTFADQSIENYSVEFVVPALTHEDTRYYTLGKGGFLKRSGYALTRAVITRADDGRETFNASEVLGAGMAAGISNLYYPAPERSVSKTMDKFGLNVGIDAATFMFKEFWPDINRKIFHQRD